MAKHKIKKTLPEQIMDAHQVTYRALQLNILDKTPEEQAVLLAENQVELNQIHKTLAAIGDKTGPVIAVIPITEHLSLKKLAQLSGNKKVQMIPQKDLQKTTGYIHGANNPVGIWSTKKFPIYIENNVQTAELVVSAGELGYSDQINYQDLVDLVGARPSDLLEEK